MGCHRQTDRQTSRQTGWCGGEIGAVRLYSSFAYHMPKVVHLIDGKAKDEQGSSNCTLYLGPTFESTAFPRRDMGGPGRLGRPGRLTRCPELELGVQHTILPMVIGRGLLTPGCIFCSVCQVCVRGGGAENIHPVDSPTLGHTIKVSAQAQFLPWGQLHCSNLRSSTADQNKAKAFLATKEMETKSP